MTLGKSHTLSECVLLWDMGEGSQIATEHLFYCVLSTAKTLLATSHQSCKETTKFYRNILYSYVPFLRKGNEVKNVK